MRKGYLIEGRKFKFSLLMAAQSLLRYNSGERALLQQAGIKLYFKLSETDCKKVISETIEMPKKKVQEILNGLEIGKCLAKGDFLIGEKEGEMIKL